MDGELGAGKKVSQAWPVLRFQFEALTHLPASFLSRLFHEVSIPWAVLRLAIFLKQGTEETRREGRRGRMTTFQTLAKSGKSIKQTVFKPQRRTAVNKDLLNASNVKWIFSFPGRIKGLRDGEKVRVFHLDFCLDIVPHDRHTCSGINHCVIASKMACAWKVHYQFNYELITIDMENCSWWSSVKVCSGLPSLKIICLMTKLHVCQMPW